MNSPYDVVIFTDLTTRFWHGKTAGAYRVATELRKYGYRTKVLDFFAYWLDEPEKLEEILDLIVGKNTLFIGFSGVLFSKSRVDNPDVHDFRDLKEKIGDWPLSDEEMEVFFAMLRRKFPHVKLVYGGLQETAVPSKMIIKNMDVVVKGLADVTVIELANHLKYNKPLKFMPSGGRAKLVIHDMRAAGFKFPSRGYIKYEPEDHVRSNEVLTLETSRGCLFKCEFCTFPLLGRKKNDPEYHKYVDTLAEEIRNNYQQWGVYKYIITDETFNESTQKIEDVLRARDLSGVNIEFMCFLRTDLIAVFPEQVKLLENLGMKSNFLGIETFHQPSGKAIGKSAHPDRIKEALYKLKEDNPKGTIYSGLICGLPEDNPETLDSWTPWVLDKSCPLDGFKMTPLNIAPGSGIHKDPVKFGYNKEAYANVWKNKYWTSDDAIEYTNQFMKKAWDTHRVRISGFDHLGIQNLDYTPEEIDDFVSGRVTIDQMDFKRLDQLRNQQWVTYRDTAINYERQPRQQ